MMYHKSFTYKVGDGVKDAVNSNNISDVDIVDPTVVSDEEYARLELKKEFKRLEEEYKRLQNDHQQTTIAYNTALKQVKVLTEKCKHLEEGKAFMKEEIKDMKEQQSDTRLQEKMGKLEAEMRSLNIILSGIMGAAEKIKNNDALTMILGMIESHQEEFHG